MIKVISGCQSGADIASLDAALSTGCPTGGWMPKGYRNETGLHPEFKAKYGVQAITGNSDDIASQYRERTWANAREANVTIWMELTAVPGSNGYYCTRNACRDLGRAFRVFSRYYMDRTDLVDLVRGHDVVNFAGSRESKAPGIYKWVNELLIEVFTELKGPNHAPSQTH